MVIKILLSLQREFLFWQYGIFIQSDCCLNIKMQSYQYRNSHYKDKTVSWLSYIYNGNIHTWKHSLYWNRSRFHYNMVQYNMIWLHKTLQHRSCNSNFEIKRTPHISLLRVSYGSILGKLTMLQQELWGVFQKGWWALKFSPVNKCTSFNVWIRYFVWNFKGNLWNSTQNILPIHWKIQFLYNIEILRALGFKSS